MTKYEKLYGKPVEHFPNERENVKEKLRLVNIKLTEHYRKIAHSYDYGDQVKLHELSQAKQWCEKILEDIDDT